MGVLEIELEESPVSSEVVFVISSLCKYSEFLHSHEDLINIQRLQFKCESTKIHITKFLMNKMMKFLVYDIFAELDIVSEFM